MAEYELIHEIQNLCMNNQMRDVFFDEVACNDPADYVRRLYPGREIELSVAPGAGGAVTVYASLDGLTHRFVFTPIY